MKYQIGQLLYFNDDLNCLRIIIDIDKNWSMYYLFPILNSRKTETVLNVYRIGFEQLDSDTTIRCFC